VAAGLVVGAVDLLRPPDQRSHVGKFFEKAGTDFGGATLVLRRKASENLSTLGHSLLLFCLVALAVLVAYLWWVRPRSLRTLFARVSTARATALALGIVAVLGFALNDSGITIPSMMAAVSESALVLLLARVVFTESRSRS
jgi:glucan phosphoethanolaminetransferase (alkaline phosphatase superfamily)